jgi:signal transduction histidine kinase
METGKLSVRPQQADLGRVVRQAVVAMGGRAAEQGITLSCSVAEELPSVNVDRDRIAQVINNLLGNALKFTPAGGSVQVRVTCAATENAVRVEVEDSGRGIPADKVDKVFDRLYQVDETDRRDKGGLGLGLNLCQELVELHGGRIGVESTWGVGSRFWFVLPLMGSERPVA